MIMRVCVYMSFTLVFNLVVSEDIEVFVKDSKKRYDVPFWYPTSNTLNPNPLSLTLLYSI